MRSEKEIDEGRGMMIGGLITLGIGVLFLLSNFDLIPDIDKMWPVIPIVVGMALIVGSIRRPKRPAG